MQEPDIWLPAKQEMITSLAKFWPGLLVFSLCINLVWLVKLWMPFKILFWISNGWVYMRWVIGTCYLAWVVGLGSSVIADKQKLSAKNVGLATLGFIIATASMKYLGGKVNWIWVTCCTGLQIVPFALNSRSWADRSQLLVYITNFLLIAAGWLIIAGTGW